MQFGGIAQFGVAQQHNTPTAQQWGREQGWVTPNDSTPGPMAGPTVLGRQSSASFAMISQPNYSTVQVQQPQMQQMVPVQQLAVAPPMIQNIQPSYLQQHQHHQQHQQYRVSEPQQHQYREVMLQDMQMQEMPQMVVQEVQMIQEVVQQPVYYQHQPVQIQEIQEVVYVQEPPPVRRAPTPQRPPQLRERIPPPPPPEPERVRERAVRERESPPPPPPEPEIKYVDRFVEVPVDRVVYKDVPVEVEKIVIKEVPVSVEKVVYQDREVAVEKVVEKLVYRDVPVEKVVFKEIPVEVEKIVVKEVPIAVEKVVVKEVQIPVEKLVERLVEKIVEKPVEKIVYQDRIVYQDKIVYQDRIVEVPVERTVQYETPREGNFQITSGKYQVQERSANLSTSYGQLRESGVQLASVTSGKYQPPMLSGREQISFTSQAAELAISQSRDQTMMQSREQTMMQSREHMSANVSTLGSTNLRDDRERSAQPRERSHLPFQSPQKNGGKKIGLGLKLKRNAAGSTYVQEIIQGFAAQKQGQVQVDDIVIAVDNEPVEGWDLDAIKQLTMGDEHSFCTLLIKRGTQYLQISLQRCFPDVVDELNMAAYSSIRSMS